jgi:hypothetical protein
MLDTGDIADLKFPTYHFEKSAAGKLMLAVLFGVSKYHNDTLSEGLKRCYEQRVAEGRWPLRVPIGYRFDAERRAVIPDPVRAPLVRKAFELYATGEYTLDQLQVAVNGMGLRGAPNKNHPALPVSRSQFQTILRHPFYVGILRFKGQLYEGKHVPLIPVHLFDRCQVVMTQRGKPQKRDLKPFLYRGMFTCGGCKGAITMESQKGITYVRCTKRVRPCTEGYLRQDLLQRQIVESIRNFVLPDDVIGMLRTHVMGQRQESAASARQAVNALKSTITRLDNKLGRLSDLYVDGESNVGLTEYNRRKEKLLKEKRNAVDALTLLQKDGKQRFEPVLRFIDGLTEPRLVTESGDPVKQLDFVWKVGSNFQIRAGRVRWEGRGAWKYVEELGRLCQRVAATPPPDFAAHEKCPGWWPVRDSVRTIGDQLQVFLSSNPAWA